MTLRDDIWDEVLLTLRNRGKFKISELPFEDNQRHTVRRALTEMEDMGWLYRESKQAAIWRLGNKAQLVLDVDDEIVAASRE